MYELLKDPPGSVLPFVRRLDKGCYIPFDPANSDFMQFKLQINADEAELQDADGNLMTAKEAKAFVSTLE